MNNLQDKLAVITGGTKGLGRELSLRFGQAGYYVTAIYHSDDKAAGSLENEFSTLSINGCCIKHDISSAPVSLELIPEARDIVLINNAAAFFEPKPFHLAEWSDFEAQITTSFKGSVLMVRALLKRLLKARRATIINVLSAAAEGIPPKGFSAYIPAKYALLGLTRALASEYGARGLKIFAVSPGLMDTPLTRRWNDHLRESIISGSGGVEHPAVVAGAVFELAHSPETMGLGENYTLD